jgi:hypothetical protein
MPPYAGQFKNNIAVGAHFSHARQGPGRDPEKVKSVDQADGRAYSGRQLTQLLTRRVARTSCVARKGRGTVDLP